MSLSTVSSHCISSGHVQRRLCTSEHQEISVHRHKHSNHYILSQSVGRAPPCCPTRSHGAVGRHQPEWGSVPIQRRGSSDDAGEGMHANCGGGNSRRWPGGGRRFFLQQEDARAVRGAIIALFVQKERSNARQSEHSNFESIPDCVRLFEANMHEMRLL